MSIPIKATLVAVMACAASAAEAQWLGPHFGPNISLTAEDLRMVQNAVASVHGRPVGTAASWDNPRSGNSGSDKLLQKLVRDGRPCEELHYVMRTSQRLVPSEHYVFTSCLQHDGSWKLGQS